MNPIKVARARRNGIKHPFLAARAADRAEIPFAVACAFLMQESGGGRNVWGHDPTWMVGYPEMNETVYKVYKAHRAWFGSQGCGPMQLTYGPFQDDADEAGGCWKPYPNMLTGFRILADALEAEGTWHGAAGRYNGGPRWEEIREARVYADEVQGRIQEWRRILKVQS